MLTKIVCRATDCIFNEAKLCTSEEIVYDPEEGCLTYEILDDLVEDEEDEVESNLLDDDDLEWDEDDDLFLEDELDEDDEDLDDLELEDEEIANGADWR